MVSVISKASEMKKEDDAHIMHVSRLLDLSNFIPHPRHFLWKVSCPICKGKLDIKVDAGDDFRLYTCACGYEYGDIVPFLP